VTQTHTHTSYSDAVLKLDFLDIDFPLDSQPDTLDTIHIRRQVHCILLQQQTHENLDVAALIARHVSSDPRGANTLHNFHSI
jgi:hypothetical protein